MIVLLTEPQLAEKTHSLAKIQIPGSMQRFQDKPQLDQLFKFIYLDILGIEIQILSTTGNDRKSWVSMCRGKNRYVEELRLNDPDHNPASSELLGRIGLEGSIAKKRELGSTKMEVSWSIQETHAKQLKFLTHPVGNNSEEDVPIGDRKWNDISAYQCFKGNTFEAEASKLVMRLERHCDQNEGETDGAVHWKSMGPKMRQAFQKVGGQEFSDSDWIQHIYRGSGKTRFQCCKNSQDVLLCIRAIHGGNVIALEQTGHVAIPLKWKEVLFHSRMLLWCHFNPHVRTDRWRKRK